MSKLEQDWPFPHPEDWGMYQRSTAPLQLQNLAEIPKRSSREVDLLLDEKESIKKLLTDSYHNYSGRAVMDILNPDHQKTVFFNLIDTMNSINSSVQAGVFDNVQSIPFVARYGYEGGYAFRAQKRSSRLLIFEITSRLEIFSLYIYPPNIKHLFGVSGPRPFHGASFREDYVLTDVDNALLQHLSAVLSRKAKTESLQTISSKNTIDLIQFPVSEKLSVANK